MITATRPRRIAASIVAASALMVTGLAAAPAQAAVTPKVTVHVQNQDTQPIDNVELLAFNQTGAIVSLGFTDSSGNLTAASNAKFTAGKWSFFVSDNNENFATTDLSSDYTLANGTTTDLGTATMPRGVQVSGTVKTPSGTVIKNLEVDAERMVEGDWWFENYGVSTAGGTFTVKALNVGSYRLVVFNRGLDSAPLVTSATFAAEQPGQTPITGIKVTGIKVLGKLGLAGKSTRAKNATLTITANATTFGITNPGGKLTVKDGTRTVARNVVVRNGRATINLTGLKKGRHAFTVSYAGGDLLNISKKITVTVR